ncbi:MAG: hypothetical protein P1U74_01895 [Legionellaceae bacterium]|nr:hypothetical protein [Legionellaceae bacterium]
MANEDSEVGALRYDLLIKLSEREMFDDKSDERIRFHIQQQQNKVISYSDDIDYKNKAYKEILTQAHKIKGHYLELLGYIDLYIPPTFSLEAAQHRYNDCISDLGLSDSDSQESKLMRP